MSSANSTSVLCCPQSIYQYSLVSSKAMNFFRLFVAVVFIVVVLIVVVVAVVVVAFIVVVKLR